MYVAQMPGKLEAGSAGPNDCRTWTENGEKTELDNAVKLARLLQQLHLVMFPMPFLPLCSCLPVPPSLAPHRTTADRGTSTPRPPCRLDVTPLSSRPLVPRCWDHCRCQ